MKRKGISKSTRFAVFSRDSFTCRYCGRQSDEVKLVIDHLTPVCQAGTSDPENLITSCEACNQGKGRKTIAQAAPTEMDRLRMLQEHQEQLALLQATQRAAKARREVEQEVCDYLCATFQRECFHRLTLKTLTKYVYEVGPELVFHWIDIAAEKLSLNTPDRRIGMYISGIRRKCLEEKD